MALIEIEDSVLESMIVMRKHRCDMCGKLHEFVDFDIRVCPMCLYRFLMTPAKVIREAKGRSYAAKKRGQAITMTRLFKAKRKFDSEQVERKEKMLAFLKGEDNNTI